MDASKVLRVAIYGRVSTTEQNVAIQTDELREYASRRGWSVTSEYVDRGVSGSKESRPELNRLMLDAHRRAFDVVIVWKIDRFGRSLKHLVNAIADLSAYGVAFVSLRDNIDLSTPSGRLMFQLVGAMAEFERSLIQERVRAGLQHARAKGTRLGRPPADVDWAKVHALRSSGMGWKKVAARMGVGVGTVRRLNSNECREEPPILPLMRRSSA